MDIALRKSFKEVQEMIANPPPARSRSSHDTQPPLTTTAKKREKESSLEGSKDSGRRSHKDRLKKVLTPKHLTPSPPSPHSCNFKTQFPT